MIQHLAQIPRTISNHQDMLVKVSNWTSLCLEGICKAYAFIRQSLKREGNLCEATEAIRLSFVYHKHHSQ